MSTWPRIRIRYSSGDDIVTEREITPLEVQPPFEIHAHCQLRDEVRTFRVTRITQAVLVETGEVIQDVGRHFGLASTLPPVVPDLPVFKLGPRSMTQAESKAQRNADKRELFKHCIHPVVDTHVREELLALFEHACFSCRKPGVLEGNGLVYDHHIPQFLGGRLVPGNIALLCRRCNGMKRDRPPEDYYSAEQLDAIRPILKAEVKLFGFIWKRWRWDRDGDAYLRELGVPQTRIDALRPKTEAWQRERESNRFVICTIGVDIAESPDCRGT